MRLLEQTLAYCQKLLPQSNEETEEKKLVEYNNPEGSLIIVPKEEHLSLLKPFEAIAELVDAFLKPFGIRAFDLGAKMLEGPLRRVSLPATEATAPRGQGESEARSLEFTRIVGFQAANEQATQEPPLTTGS